MDDVRSRFGDDLARHPAPPLGDLVQQAVVQGRRLRRQRRLAQFGAGGSALAVLLVIGLAAGPLNVGGDDAGQPGGLGFGAPGGPVGTAGTSSSDGAPGEGERGPGAGELLREPGGSLLPTPSTKVIDTVRIREKPRGELLTTTEQGALLLLTRLLPRGRTSGYASLPSVGAGPGMPYVQLYLDRGKGPGMLRLSIYQDKIGGDPAPGTVELTEVPGNCVQDKMVTVHHGGGLQVDLLISTCLAWDGTQNPSAAPVLTVDEAVGIAANPIWGTRLPAEIVTSGEKLYPALARSND
ncbi:hypothetical protein JNW91_00890 [Micromonospora sp. STR1_7]|uniref:Uncharacterized protein n=1 Tax=Micromonospora parastrephiae TaxID=2806101 RepID=A0ABS1XMS2_9ACTN|nr:hypothetical protein [Micromonospora parastrephiae]MBM0230556.1 hypothetical protein [Micromonospora parastrephiae]